MTTKNEALDTLKVIVAKLDALAADVAAIKAAKPASGGGTAAGLLPNYGKHKGEPIRGADQDTLLYYRGGCERTLGDPSKEKWHAKERALMDAIDAELARQAGESSPQNEAPF